MICRSSLASIGDAYRVPDRFDSLVAAVESGLDAALVHTPAAQLGPVPAPVSLSFNAVRARYEASTTFSGGDLARAADFRWDRDAKVWHTANVVHAARLSAFADAGARFLRELEVVCLRFPYDVEFCLDHLPKGIEGIGCRLAGAGEPDPDTLTLCVTGGEIGTHRLVTARRQLRL